LAEQGVLFLLLTGGEFTLQPHWPQIYRHARQCGFLVTLMTNATRVDDTFIRELTQLRPRRIETTIYGFTAATYDAVTGVPGSHARFQAGLSRIRQAGLPLEVKMLVLQSNAHEFELTRRWAADEGLAFRYDAIINPRLDGNLGPAAERLSPDLLAKWLKNNPTPITSPASKPTTPSPLSTGPTPSPLFTCGAGIRTIHLDSNGLAHPCMMWRWNPLDTRSDRWALDWKDHIASLRRQKAPLESRCGTCGHRSGCFTCPALSRLETGTAGMPVEYFCRVMGNQVE
jgi:radical SAM protein with 4Fe4S-binding SPASM domain